MLIAISSGERVNSWEILTPTNEEFICPHCNGNLSLILTHMRNGFPVITHFRHKNECPYHGEPESALHEQMKLDISNILKLISNVTVLEHRIGNRIADIYCETKSGLKIVVECQCSKISEEEICSKTKDYNNQGIGVLWISGVQPYSNKDYNNVSMMERVFHKMYFGRVYFYDVTTRMINAVHFEPTGRYLVDSAGNEYYKYYKRCREFSIRSVPIDRFYIVDNSWMGLKIIRFGDKRWWKRGNDGNTRHSESKTMWGQ